MGDVFLLLLEFSEWFYIFILNDYDKSFCDEHLPRLL